MLKTTGDHMRATTLGLSALAAAIGFLTTVPSNAVASRPPNRRVCTCALGGGSGVPVPLVRLSDDPTFAAPRAPAVRSKVYVTNELEGNLSVIDAATNQVIRSVLFYYKVPNSPYEMVFTPRGVVVAPDGQSVWVTAPIPQSDCAGAEGALCDGPNLPPGAKEEIVVVDPLADTILARISVPSLDGQGVHLSGVVIDKDSRYAYIAANGASQVVRVDVQTRKLAGRVDLGANRDPQGIAMCDDKLVIANGAGKSLSVVETSRGTAEEVPLGGVAIRAVCSGDARFVYVSLFDTREIARYEFETGAITRMPLPAGAVGPSQLALTADGKRLYVLDQGLLMGRPLSDKMYELDLQTGAVRSTITVGRSPRGLVLSEDGKTAYTSNMYDGNISIVDLTSRRVLATVKTGTAPLGIGVWRSPGLVP
jgi:YVTN family beta-propeller protein